MINRSSSDISPSPRPATRENPRIITNDEVLAFEKMNPALSGIGQIMIDLGIWVVKNDGSGIEGIVI